MTRMRVFVINPNMIIIVLIHLATFFTGLSSKVVVIFRVTVVEALLLSAAMLNECLTAGCESYTILAACQSYEADLDNN